MITAKYVRTMAKYNAWQNRQLMDAMETLTEEALKANHNAFFGSILATANHILWADRVWMSRLSQDDDAKESLPSCGLSDSVHLTDSFQEWKNERCQTDERILQWSDHLSDAEDLSRDVTWYSAIMGSTMTRPQDGLIVHMFNHQTHHRGQIHAMLTASGVKNAPVSDLFCLPDDL